MEWLESQQIKIDPPKRTKKIAVETEGFTKISKSDCETLIERIAGMREENDHMEADNRF